MALISHKQSGWTFYRSVHFRLFCGIFLLMVLSVWIITGTVLGEEKRFLEEQKITQTSRYASSLAGEISLAGNDSKDLESFLHGELRAINSGIRVLVLDERCVVTDDSSQSRIGDTIIDELVLKALDGHAESVTESSIYRTAVPIRKGGSEEIKGVVYAFADMKSVQQAMDLEKGNILWSAFLVIFAGGILLHVLLSLEMGPVKKILMWLQNFEKKNVTKPILRHDDEYTRIVNGIENVTRDMVTQDQSRREFVSNVSHEMKTPLSSIKVLTESLLLQENVPEEIYREFLQDINSEIDRMSNIVNDLLTLTRLDEGEKGLNLSVFSLKEMLEVILRRVEPLSREKKITLEMLESDDIQIEADETKLTLAFSNLIQNAIKYNKDEGSVCVQCVQKEEIAIVTIRDTGIGIEEEHFDKLFDRFYRVDKARDRSSGGNGLGLSIVKKIVTLHNGEIRLESKVGEGTTFTLLLPMDQGMEEDV